MSVVVQTKIPSATVLVTAATNSITKDKPIYLDYYVESLDKTCCVGVSDTSKYLVKSGTEYTSTILAYSKVEDCLIIETENSLYVVSASIPIKKLTSSKHE